MLTTTHFRANALRWAACGIGASLAVAVLELLGGRFVGLQASALTGKSVPLEYYTSPRSFSEVAIANAVLKALAEQALAELRRERLRAELTNHDRGIINERAHAAAVAVAVQGLRQGLQAFKDSAQERFFRWDLLILLKREKMYAQWITTYLAMVYQHPTDELIGWYARDAIWISQEAGRDQELLKALQRFVEIPIDSNARDLVRSALAEQRRERPQDNKSR